MQVSVSEAILTQKTEEGLWSSRHGSAVVNPTSTHADAGSIPGHGVAMSCGAGRRRDSGLEFWWLWCRPAAAAPIQPLAWEPPVALKSRRKVPRLPADLSETSQSCTAV